MLDNAFANQVSIADEIVPFAIHGRVIRVVGNLVHACFPNGRVGELCELKSPAGELLLHAEVVGFNPDGVLLTPIGNLQSVSSSTLVVPTGKVFRVAVSRDFIGRVVDHFGRPIDGKANLSSGDQKAEIYKDPPKPLSRGLISRKMATGIRAIDALLTIGEGQRIGVFGGPGCGKSTLLGQIMNGADADIVVVGMIGERGREVREFVEENLSTDSLENKVVVVATSDQPALERAKAAYTATTYAEYFSQAGNRVLLVVDSITRFVRALREIGLAAGEPAVRGGLTPSVFTEIPRLLERPGCFGDGSITAIYSVLAEGEVEKDVVCEEVKAIVDGHVTLSSKNAASGQFPAIDVLNSRSRTMPKVVTHKHLQHANELRLLMSKYDEIEFLLQVGEYQKGSDTLADRAIERKSEIARFLNQSSEEYTNIEETLEWLQRVTQ